MPYCPSCNRTISLGSTLCRACGASIPDAAATMASLERQVRSLLEQGKKIEAIKIYREHTGLGLIEAKDAVEALQQGASPTTSVEPDADLESEVFRVLRQQGKIHAVKLHQSRTGMSLLDSQQAVEALAGRNCIKVERTGCNGVLVVAMVALMTLAVVVVWLLLKR